MFRARKDASGFTLLELLIVISIIAILSVIVILVLNPSEMLKKARDSQRLVDLNTIKTAIGLYLVGTNTPNLGQAGTNTGCFTGTNKYIWFSKSGVSSTVDAGIATSSASQAVAGKTNGTGWIPVNLSSLSGGSPISNWPIDPVNVVASSTAPAMADLVYRYGCNSANQFEVDATLESNAFTLTDNKQASDGGDNSSLYEVGTNLATINLSCDPTVTYGGQTYQTVYIGNQCWFKQNLNVGTMLVDGSAMPTLGNGQIEKWCFGNYLINNGSGGCSDGTSSGQGGLYTWAEANQLGANCDSIICTPPVNNQGICPFGWHIPTDSEYKTLEIYLGMTQIDTDNTGWRGTDQGTKLYIGGSSGFAALTSGYRATNGTYFNNNDMVSFWTSSEYSNQYAWWRQLGNPFTNYQVARNSSDKPVGYSVRCLKN